jgi:hypothetical protein
LRFRSVGERIRYGPARPVFSRVDRKSEHARELLSGMTLGFGAGYKNSKPSQCVASHYYITIFSKRQGGKDVTFRFFSERNARGQSGKSAATR